MKKILFPVIFSLVLTAVIIAFMGHFSIYRGSVFEPLTASELKNCQAYVDVGVKGACNTPVIGTVNYFGWPLNFSFTPDSRGWTKKEAYDINSPLYNSFNFMNFVLDCAIIFAIILIITFSFVIWISLLVKIIKKQLSSSQEKIFLLISGLVVSAIIIALTSYSPHNLPNNPGLVFGPSPENCTPMGFGDCNPPILGNLSYFGWPLNFRTTLNPSSWLSGSEYNNAISLYNNFNLINFILDYVIIAIITFISLVLIIKIIQLIRNKFLYAKNKNSKTQNN